MPGRVNSGSMPSSASPFLSVSFHALASALISTSIVAIRSLITSNSDAMSDRSMSIRCERSSLPSAVNLASSF